jgi:uncharacterized membrane protein
MVTMFEFIQRYFIEPIYSGEGYNVYNTVVYGLLLGVGIILTEDLLKKFKIEIDGRFAFALLPFLTLAAILRSLVDASVIGKSFFFITPGIFLTTFTITLLSLLGAKILERSRGIDYSSSMFVAGVVLLIYPGALVVQNIAAPIHFISIIVLTGVSSWLTILLFRGLDASKWGNYIIPAHMLDASATILAVEYLGYFEEHVFEDFLIQIAGTAFVIFPLKIIVLAIVFVALKRMEAGPFWYFALVILGYAPGLRDTLTIVLVG